METRIYTRSVLKGLTNGTPKTFFRDNSYFCLEMGTYTHFRQLWGKKIFFWYFINPLRTELFLKDGFLGVQKVQLFIFVEWPLNRQ